MENETNNLSTPAPKSKPVSHTKRQLATVGLLVIASTSAGFVGGYFGGNNPSLSNLSNEASQQIVSSESGLINNIAKEVGPSVVSVNVTSRGVTENPFFGDQSFSRQSSGTGFIIDTEGIIVTNRHVVPAGTSAVSVTLSDGTKLDKVEVIGRTADGDPLDVAFLKINDKKGKELKAAKLGDSSKAQVGDRVVAIGNALGQFQNTVTSGIISGYGRDVEASDGTNANTETLQNLFQTDAAINQGNSGGPLVNAAGEVIGINTAVAGGDAQNIGFAIPINDTQGLIRSVLKEGKLLRPYLGVRFISLTDDYAYQLNLDTKRGAYIAPQSGGNESIMKDSPAEKAGLKEKDIIIKVNDTEINERNSLTSVLGRFSVGEKVKLTIIRDGKQIELDATLEAAPTS